MLPMQEIFSITETCQCAPSPVSSPFTTLHYHRRCTPGLPASPLRRTAPGLPVPGAGGRSRARHRVHRSGPLAESALLWAWVEAGHGAQRCNQDPQGEAFWRQAESSGRRFCAWGGSAALKPRAAGSLLLKSLAAGFLLFKPCACWILFPECFRRASVRRCGAVAFGEAAEPVNKGFEGGGPEGAEGLVPWCSWLLEGGCSFWVLLNALGCVVVISVLAIVCLVRHWGCFSLI